jgi:hypothetical protein
MKLGNPAKTRVRVAEDHGCYFVYADNQPVIKSFSRHDARRLAVALRRSIAAHNWPAAMAF